MCYQQITYVGVKWLAALVLSRSRDKGEFKDPTISTL